MDLDGISLDAIEEHAPRVFFQSSIDSSVSLPSDLPNNGPRRVRTSYRKPNATKFDFSRHLPLNQSHNITNTACKVRFELQMNECRPGESLSWGLVFFDPFKTRHCICPSMWRRLTLSAPCPINDIHVALGFMASADASPHRMHMPWCSRFIGFLNYTRHMIFIQA